MKVQAMPLSIFRRNRSIIPPRAVDNTVGNTLPARNVACVFAQFDCEIALETIPRVPTTVRNRLNAKTPRTPSSERRDK
jgi:hypothetical protein